MDKCIKIHTVKIWKKKKYNNYSNFLFYIKSNKKEFVML